MSAERKHQTRRAQLLSLGSTARPRLRRSGIPSGQPLPGRGARHGRAPRRQPRCGGARGGHRAALGRERRLRAGGGRRERAAGGLRWLWLLPAQEPPAAGEGAPGTDRGCGAVELSTGRGCCQYAFSSSSVFIFLLLPVTFAFLLPDKLNKHWKFCVCVRIGEREMSLLIIIFLTINASHETRPPLTMPCRSGAARLRSRLPRRAPPEGAIPAPGPGAPRGSPRARAAPRGSVGAARERRPRPDPALSPRRALTCL